MPTGGRSFEKAKDELDLRIKRFECSVVVSLDERLVVPPDDLHVLL
jgi:hypothetical protein